MKLNLKTFVPVTIMSIMFAGCYKSETKGAFIVENHSIEEKIAFKVNTDTVWQFEEFGSSRFEQVCVKQVCIRNQTNDSIHAETKRTKKRLSESSEVFWSLSGLIDDDDPSFFVGDKATLFSNVPDYVRSYFHEAGYNGEPNLVVLINAYKNGDRKAADLIERLVLYSAQKVNLIGEISLLAYSPRRGLMIIETHAGKRFIFDYRTFMEAVPFANILFEDYLRTISDGLYSSYANFDTMEIEYLEKQYDAIYEKFKR